MITKMIMKIVKVENNGYYSNAFGLAINGVTYVEELSFEQAKTICEIYNNTLINVAFYGVPQEQPEQTKEGK